MLIPVDFNLKFPTRLYIHIFNISYRCDCTEGENSHFCDMKSSDFENCVNLTLKYNLN